MQAPHGAELKDCTPGAAQPLEVPCVLDDGHATTDAWLQASEAAQPPPTSHDSHFSGSSDSASGTAQKLWTASSKAPQLSLHKLHLQNEELRVQLADAKQRMKVRCSDVT